VLNGEYTEGLGVESPHLIHDWPRRYPEFPKPVVELIGILLSDWSEVKSWAKSTGLS
jgi:hypothetical protein